MSFDWSEYIDLGYDLLDSTRMDLEEAYYRASISRAYYGVFCLSRDKAGLKTYKPTSKADLGVHQKVIKQYKASADQKEKSIGLALDRLRRMRNKADYDGDQSVKIGEAERAVITAREVLQDLWVP